MPLMSTKVMFEKAMEGGYAIGAFNVNNMEIIQGIVEAAMEERLHLFFKYLRVLESMLTLHI